jgi:hypothetical protein
MNSIIHGAAQRSVPAGFADVPVAGENQARKRDTAILQNQPQKTHTRSAQPSSARFVGPHPLNTTLLSSIYLSQ